MALQPCPPNLKTAFTSAGITLTPAQEHLVASNPKLSAIDWAGLMQKLGNLAALIVPIIIAFVSGQTPPTPAPAPTQGTAAAACCDHHCCCLKTFEASVKTVKAAGEHLAECCAYG
jgi:hypothetical protein